MFGTTMLNASLCNHYSGGNRQCSKQTSSCSGTKKIIYLWFSTWGADYSIVSALWVWSLNLEGLLCNLLTPIAIKVYFIHFSILCLGRNELLRLMDHSVVSAHQELSCPCMLFWGTILSQQCRKSRRPFKVQWWPYFAYFFIC